MLRLLPYLQDPLSREGARDAAREELRKPIYGVTEDNPIQKVVNWVLGKITEAFADAVSITPGGLPSLLVVLAVIVGIAVAARLGLGPTGLFRNSLTDRRRGSRAITAEENRAEAEELAARGEFKEAVRARFRAIIRELEQRSVLDPRPGRTAGEIAREGGTAVPAIRADLHAVATTFDLIWYGRHEATASDYAVVKDADDRIRSGRLTLAALT